MDVLVVSVSASRSFSAGLRVILSASTIRRVTLLHLEDISQIAVVAVGPQVAAIGRIDELRRDTNALARRRIEPSSTDCTPSSRPTVRISTERPL